MERDEAQIVLVARCLESPVREPAPARTEPSEYSEMLEVEAVADRGAEAGPIGVRELGSSRDSELRTVSEGARARPFPHQARILHSAKCADVEFSCFARSQIHRPFEKNVRRAPSNEISPGPQAQRAS